MRGLGVLSRCSPIWAILDKSTHPCSACAYCLLLSLLKTGLVKWVFIFVNWSQFTFAVAFWLLRLLLRFAVTFAVACCMILVLVLCSVFGSAVVGAVAVTAAFFIAAFGCRCRVSLWSAFQCSKDSGIKKYPPAPLEMILSHQRGHPWS